MRYLEVRRHTMRHKPGVHLNRAGVVLARQVGMTMGRFDLVITSQLERAYETALAMGYAVDRQDDRLSSITDGVLDELDWDAGFATWGRAVKLAGLAALFARSQAAVWREIMEGLPEENSALIVTHGGMIEAGAVAALPDANHAAWGGFCDYCEGVRLSFDNGLFQDLQVLRVPFSLTTYS